ncbi:hypothetical protein [Stigmatella hybrida]|uniref:hypothetical protein n=1 Tax=Stigmatella hybrida TaxID=394097 RepID=UPI001CDA92D8|nr:hypothetical protein [Stigmatella hybrida]
MTSQNSHDDIRRMTLEQVRQHMLVLVSQENYNHHRIGLLYNHVVDNGLAEATGYKNAQAYFAEHVKALSRAALAMYGAVAKAFNASACTKYGVSALSLLRTYEEAASITSDPNEPGPTPIDVPNEQGVVQPKPFSACTVEDLRKALQFKRQPTSSKPLSDGEMAQVQGYREAVTSRFPATSPVRVSVRNRKGQALVTFKDVPLADVDKLTEALMDGALPVRSVA